MLLFEKYQKFIKEIDDRHVEQLSQFHSTREIEENPIFGERKRILLPFHVNGGLSDRKNYSFKLVEFFRKLENLDVKLDLTNKLLYTEKFRNGMTIMRFIDRILAGKEKGLTGAIRNNHYSPEPDQTDGGYVLSYFGDLTEIKRELELTWNKFAGSDNISFIATRYPIDVARMSDWGALNSCHARDGSYYNCAVGESLGHGFVIFGVRHESTLSQEWLDENQRVEIFSDSDRGIRGLTPISRMRARKFEVNQDGGIDAIIYTQESRAYGNTFIAKDASQKVKEWLQRTQKETIQQIKEALAADESSIYFQRVVSYADTIDQVMINELLGTNYANLNIYEALDVDVDEFEEEDPPTEIDSDEMDRRVSALQEHFLRVSGGLHRDWLTLSSIDYSTEFDDENGNEYVSSAQGTYKADLEAFFLENPDETLPEGADTYSKFLQYYSKLTEENLKEIESIFIKQLDLNSGYNDTDGLVDFWTDGKNIVLVLFDTEPLDGHISYDGDDFFQNFNELSPRDITKLILVLYKKLKDTFDPSGTFEEPPEEQESFPFYANTERQLPLKEKKSKVRLIIRRK